MQCSWLDMDRTERFYKIEQMLHARRVVTVDTFIRELGVSRATFKRDLEYLRERINAPIVFDREAGGYRFAADQAGAPHELPGLWFNASEVYALLSMQQLLSNIEPGLLSRHVEPLKTRLLAILSHDDFHPEDISERIRLAQANQRAVSGSFFELLATATLRRRRICITHYHRERDETVVREVSPQQLVFYRYNWYLDAWCHLRGGLRSFAVDAISAVEFVDKPARAISRAQLKSQLESGYGIFGGSRVQWAKLRFSPERARWVAQEQWHPKQKSRLQKDGYMLLDVPYSDPRELLMQVMGHGEQVEVLGPAGLRRQIKGIMEQALQHYIQ
jgi:predicted DNA-binding transcriptional regulator YafY